MSDFAKKWGEGYNKCIQPLQGKGSPRTKETISVAEDSAPLLKALIAIDKTDPMTKNAGKEREKLHKGLEKEVKGFKSAASKYKKLIAAAVKTTDKGDHKDAYRSLKTLGAHLDTVDAAIDHHLFTSSKQFEKDSMKARERVEKETDKAQKKGLSDVDVNKEADYAKQLRQLTQFSTQVKTVATKAKSAVQAIKADPTPKTYNDVMESGGRNYTQQFVNLIKLSKDAKCPPKVKELLKGLDGYRSGLSAYGDGNRRRIPLDTPEKDVLAYNKEFVQLLKATYPYAEKMQAYLKKHKLK